MAAKKAATKKLSGDALDKRLAAGSGKGERKKQTQIKSWSFTRYWDYKLCPRKAKLKYLDKIEEPPNDAMARGAEIGQVAEAYIKGTVAKFADGTEYDGTKPRMPAVLEKFADEFKKLRALYKKSSRYVVVEESWAFTKVWGKTLWNDWDGCVVRIKMDAGHRDGKTMILRDWKTGKYRAEKREEYVEQLELYALAALLNDPFVEKVVAYLCYLDAGVTFPVAGTDDEKRLTFTRADIPKLKKTWDKRTRAMLLDKSFAPRPNEKCRWCHYRKENTKNLPGKKQLCQY